MGMAATAGVAMMPRMGRAFPSVFPHGTTIYKPEKCWSGFTVFGVETAGEGCVLIDMNGNVVKEWKHVSELKFWDSKAAEMYGVRSIPANILIGPDGTILARNLMGNDLYAKLAELLNKPSKSGKNE